MEGEEREIQEWHKSMMLHEHTQKKHSASQQLWNEKLFSLLVSFVFRFSKTSLSQTWGWRMKELCADESALFYKSAVVRLESQEENLITRKKSKRVKMLKRIPLHRLWSRLINLLEGRITISDIGFAWALKQFTNNIDLIKST